MLSVVTRGRVKVVQTAPGGRDVLVEIAGPGAAHGDADVFAGTRHGTTAIALEDVEVVQLPVADLIAVLASEPDASLAVLRGVAKHLRSLRQRVGDLGEGGVERRLAIAMCRLCEMTDATPGDFVEIPVPLSRQDLADLVGTSLETAIRVMTRWARKGVVATRSGGFVVQDCAKLQSLVGSTPRGAPLDACDAVCIRNPARS